MGFHYLTEKVTLQCICGGKVVLAGRGVSGWKIGGSAVLTAEGLEGASVICPQPPPAGTGLGCSRIQMIVVGKASKATVGGQTPLLRNLIAVTDRGGMVRAVGPVQSAAWAAGSESDKASPVESDPVRHQPSRRKRGKLRFSLKDDEGKQVPREWYRVTMPNGAVAYGLLDENGRAEVLGLDRHAECKLEFPRLNYVAWSVTGNESAATQTIITRETDSFQTMAAAADIPNPRRLRDHCRNADLRRDRGLFDLFERAKEIHVPLRDRLIAADDSIYECKLEQPHPATSVTFRFVDARTGELKKKLAIKLHGPGSQIIDLTTDDLGEVVVRGKPEERVSVALALTSTAGLGHPDDLVGPQHRGLDDLLTETIIGATQSPDKTQCFERNGGSPTFATATSRAGLATADITKRPLWHVTVPSGTFDRVTNVTCAVHDGQHVSTVCESVNWSQFVVKFNEREVELPLTEAHLVRTRSIVGGERRGDSRCWPLPAENDIALEHIFAYDIKADRSLAPISKSEIASNRFMARSVAQRVEGRIGSASIDVPVIEMRIVIVVGIACNKARPDFDPANLLLSARLYPTAMFWSSVPVAEAKGTIRIVRPREQPPHNENMRRYLQSGLFADNNDPITPRGSADGIAKLVASIAEITKNPIAFLTYPFINRLAKTLPGLPIPLWDNIFSYYQVDVSQAEYVVVRPRIGAPKNLPWGSSQSTRRPIDSAFSKWASGLQKVAGQGAYDSVHIAPPMFLDPVPDITPEEYEEEMRTKFQNIAMAPFCIHNCLHIHWRWSRSNRTKQNLGWSMTGVPYSEEGAPMVHPNQMVTIKIEGATLNYIVSVVEPRAAEWQILMHHGCGYAIGLSNGWIDWTLRNGLRLVDVSDTRFWAVVYWCLRYGLSATVPDASRLLRFWRAFERNEVAADPRLRRLAERG